MGLRSIFTIATAGLSVAMMLAPTAIAATHSSAQAASIHPYHVSMAEAEYNAKSQSLEVALQINAIDLEDALSRLSGKRISLDGTKDIDRRLKAYVTSNFILKDSTGQARPLKWVGKELFVQTAWLYLEIPLTQAQLKGAKLTNTVLFSTQPEQKNSVLFKQGKQRQSLLFTGESPTQPVPPE